QLNQTLLIKDPQLSFINRYKMVDWYTANEPAPIGERSTLVAYPFFKERAPLIPAGLIGPVQIHTSTIFFDR
ncbi:hypothetical protein QEH56_10860, partial [Pelagicoccus enzymogenes]|uniref:hypothetical protein n=1 Tax=Pelagicoccus enzymogenes TaxID=2773457 RepID=UPI00280DB7CE